MTPTDAAFLKAITTIRTLPRGPNAVRKPSPRRKVELYGLYKQATEGDIEGIMPRPEGTDPQARANQLKWDAWKSQQGKTKQEAKLHYVGLLLETIQALVVSDGAAALPAELVELEELYVRAKSTAAESSARSSAQPPVLSGGQPGSHSRRLSVGSVASTYSHFLRSGVFNSPSATPSLRNATFSEYGLSEKDRSDLQADQLVDRLQSVYPPVLPGALPAAVPYESDVWPRKPKEYTPSEDADPGRRGDGFPYLLNRALNFVCDTFNGLLRRLFIDSVSFISLLILLRVVASRPDVLQRSKVLRVVVNTVIRMGAVILDGFGIELRLKKPRASTGRSLPAASS